MTPTQEACAEETTVQYAGHDRRGRGAGGVTTQDAPASLTERLFLAGWRSLRVTRSGSLVGEIAPHPDTGKRMWWAECPEGVTVKEEE